MGRNVNPAQMAKLQTQMAKMMDPRVLQQMGEFCLLLEEGVFVLAHIWLQ